MSDAELLPPNALQGMRLSLSVSASPDLMRLGLLEEHLRLALAEVTRAVVISGGEISYGGHLDPSGYTAFIVHELQRYGRRDDPLKLYLAWNVHSKASDSELHAVEGELALFAEPIFLSPDGERIALGERSKLRVGGGGAEFDAHCLTAMRKTAIAEAKAAFLVGGRRAGYEGKYPGIVEEALIALETGKPIYLAAGFGGATYDVARALQLPGSDWLPRPEDEADAGLKEGLQKVAELKTRAEKSLDNGLSPDEQKLLLASYRPSEIAALVGLGLGRLGGH